MAAASNAYKEWSNEMTGYFIDEVEKIPNLWDIRHELYAKRTAKRYAYMNISRDLQERWPEKAHLFTIEKLMLKFSMLKRYFSREKQKWNKSFKSGSAGISMQSQWIYYTRLSFLNDTVTPESSNDSLDDSLVSLLTEAEVNFSEGDNAIEDSQVQVSSIKFELPESSEHSDRGFEVPSITVEPLKSSEPADRAFEVPSTKFKPLESSEHSDSAFEVSSISSSKELETLPIEKRNNVRSTRHSEGFSNQAKCRKKMKYTDTADDFFGMFVVSQLQEIHDPVKRDQARLEIHRILLKYKYGDSI